MNGEHVQELLEEYALGSLDPEIQARVGAHLAGCANCSAQAAAYAETLATLPEALASVSPYMVPEQLRDTVMARILAAPSVMPQDGRETTASIPAPSVPPQPLAGAIRTWATLQLRWRLALIA